MLGFSLILVGIVMLINGELQGIIAFIIAIPFLFTHSGVLIDTKNKRIRKYTGIFNFRFGKWIDVSSARHLQIIQVR